MVADSMNDQTSSSAYARYIKDNKYVLSLPRDSLPRTSPSITKPSKETGLSVRSLVLADLRELISCFIRLPYDYWYARKEIYATWRKKGARKKFSAIVIGNGPSQSSLSSDELNHFKANGGETIVVNYWNLNEQIKGHIPSYMVFSDPNTFKGEKGEELVHYLKSNKEIQVVIPISYSNIFAEKGIENRTFMFIDTELKMLRGISPCLPRGYVSMTLYKALAWALHLGYHKIGVIGMDNTYPRNLYCDECNRVVNHEIHAGVNDYAFDQSSIYPTVAAAVYDIYRLFKDLELFPNFNVYNLDRYSLTDRFKKISFGDFVNIIDKCGGYS